MGVAELLVQLVDVDGALCDGEGLGWWWWWNWVDGQLQHVTIQLCLQDDFAIGCADSASIAIDLDLVSVMGDEHGQHQILGKVGRVEDMLQHHPLSLAIDHDGGPECAMSKDRTLMVVAQ
jgi:hypothetical protein